MGYWFKWAAAARLGVQLKPLSCAIINHMYVQAAALRRLQSADIAWLVIGGGVIAYELTADDLLSEATERYYGAHPILTRIVILAVAAHLGGVMPAAVDVFSAKNLLHKWAVANYPLARTERLANKAKKMAQALA